MNSSSGSAEVPESSCVEFLGLGSWSSSRLWYAESALNRTRGHVNQLSHRRKVFPADLSVPADIHLLENLFDFARYVVGLAVPMTPLVSLMPMPNACGRTEAEIVVADVPLRNSKKLVCD